MITDHLLKKRYIQQLVRRDAASIYDTQSALLRQNFKNEQVNRLASFLSGHPYSMSGVGGTITYSFHIFTLLRLLDIRYSRKQSQRRLILYNSIIWPKLYRDTLTDLRYGYTKDIKRAIAAELQRMNPDKIIG